MLLGGSSMPRPLTLGDYTLLPDTVHRQWYVNLNEDDLSDSLQHILSEEVQRHYPGWGIIVTSLPVIAINECEGESISRYEEAHITIQLTDVRCQTQGQYYYTSTARAHWRGVTASTLEKKSYSLKLTDAADDDLDAPLLGLQEGHTFILDAMAADLGRMRNRLCFDLWNEVSTLRDSDMVANGTRGHYVELLLNGSYHGVYCLCEKVNRKLLGLKKYKVDDSADDGSQASPYRGHLYKCSRGDDLTSYLALPEDYTESSTTEWYGWDLEYPDEYPSTEAWHPLIDLFQYTMAEDTAQTLDLERLSHHFQTDNFFEYPLFNFACKMMDNAMHNTYISFRNYHKDSIAWITPWDLDGSFGRDGTSWDNSIYTASEGLSLGWVRPYRSLHDRRDSTFMAELAIRWDRWRTATFAVEHVCQHIDSMAGILVNSGAWQREVERWDSLNVMYAGIGPLHLEADLTTETTMMKEWYERNFANLDARFLPYLPQPSAITTITADAPRGMTEDHWYDATGRAIASPLSNGIYIHNGQILIRKR